MSDLQVFSGALGNLAVQVRRQGGVGEAGEALRKVGGRIGSGG